VLVLFWVQVGGAGELENDLVGEGCRVGLHPRLAARFLRRSLNF
jgi:hypothetical protein